MMGMKIKKFKRSSAFFMAAALCLGSTSGVYAMDESELSRIIEEAKNTDTSRYTPESCESLQAALEGAENLLSREDVTEEELGAGGMMLQAILGKWSGGSGGQVFSRGGPFGGGCIHRRHTGWI